MCKVEQPSTEPQQLNEEQRAALQLCIDWYTSSVYPRGANKTDFNPPEMVTTEAGTRVVLQKSKHVYSPTAWLHYSYDRYLRSLGDKDATERVAAFRATM